MQAQCLSPWLTITAVFGFITKNSRILSIIYKTLVVPSNLKVSPFKCEK